jgi:hypothetical protein
LFLTVVLPAFFVSSALADMKSDMQKGVKAGDAAKVKQLLAAGADVNAKIIGSGSTSLIVSAAHPETRKSPGV